MNSSVFPAEIWLMNFEMDLPGEICVVRQHYVYYIRQACHLHNAGQQNTVSRLPEHERSQWAQMCRFYNLNQPLRRIAQGLRLQERWLSIFNDPESSPESPGPLVPHRPTRNSTRFIHFLVQRYQRHFCGRGSPRYTVFDLCTSSEGGPYYVDLRRARLETQQFLQCARGPMLFNNLTNMDIIVAVSRADRSTAQGDVNRLVRCIREKWEALGSRTERCESFWDLPV
jgi:hypothetical protein